MSKENSHQRSDLSLLDWPRSTCEAKERSELLCQQELIPPRIFAVQPALPPIRPEDFESFVSTASSDSALRDEKFPDAIFVEGYAQSWPVGNDD
jgi:hypothetical protein